MEKLGIIIVIESGDLEQKTRLLIDSIRTFGGAAKDCKIWAIKPRKGKSLKKETLEFLKNQNVEFIDINLNKKWRLYGFANKIYASAYVEEKYGDQYETLLFLDSDTLVLGDLSKIVLGEEFDVALKPEDTEFFEARGPHLPFWNMIYQTTALDSEEIWKVKTSVTQVEIPAYFNSGVILATSKIGLFSKWHKNFEKIIDDSRFYRLPYIEYYFLEQALLAATIIKLVPKWKVQLLDNKHNYPLNFEDVLKRKRSYFKYDAAILHYHRLLKENWSSEIAILSSDKIDWLKQRLPLTQKEKSVLRNVFNASSYIIWRTRRLLYLNFIK